MLTIEKRNQTKSLVIYLAIMILIVAAALACAGQKAHAEKIKGEVAVCAPTITSVENTKQGVLLTWKKVKGRSVSTYRVYRKSYKSGSKWKCLKTCGSSMSTWQNVTTKLTEGNAYKYVVIAYKKKAHELSAKTPPAGAVSKAVKIYRLDPVKMTSISATSATGASAKWAKKRCASGYEIQFAKEPLFLSYETVVVRGSSKTSINASLNVESKKRYARIRAYKTHSGVTSRSCWSYSPNYKNSPKLKIRYYAHKGKKMEYRKLAKQKLYGYDVFQGGSQKDGYSYSFLLNKKKNLAKLTKIDLTTGKVKKVGKSKIRGHANSLTYNPDNKKLVCTNSDRYIKYFTLINPGSMKKSRMKQAVIPKEICGISKARIKNKIIGFTAISYNPVKKKYVARIKNSRNFVVLSKSFVVERYISVSKRLWQLKQSMICTNDLIIDLQSANGGRYNILVLYDWAGNYISTVRMDKKYEAEDIFEYNGNLYGQVYHSYMKKHKFKRCNYLFRAE